MTEVRTVAVYHRKDTCTVCMTQPVVFQAVNGAIWDGEKPAPEARTRGYRQAGAAVLLAHGISADVRMIARHAEHVEMSARLASEKTPPRGADVTVYPSSFEGVSARVSRLGMLAADALERRLASEDTKTADLVAAAALGLKAVQGVKQADQRDEAIRLKALGTSGDDPAIKAIFVFTAGMAPELNETEAIDVTPLSEMRRLMIEERTEANRLARE